jgi:hypothetical protein
LLWKLDEGPSLGTDFLWRGLETMVEKEFITYPVVMAFASDFLLFLC